MAGQPPPPVPARPTGKERPVIRIGNGPPGWGALPQRARGDAGKSPRLNVGNETDCHHERQDGLRATGESHGLSCRAAGIGKIFVGRVTDPASAAQRPRVDRCGGSATLRACPSHARLTIESPVAKAFIQARAAAKEQQRKANVPKF